MRTWKGMRAYVLVRVKTGMEREALQAFQGIASLEEIDFLFGEFDYILTLQAVDTTTLARLITTRIRKAPGVLQTTTLLEAPFA
jgi:DNA-binding Lrp family transcriptional regulator